MDAMSFTILPQPIHFNASECDSCDRVSYLVTDTPSLQVITTSADGDNIVQNGDFADGLTDWTTQGITDVSGEACVTPEETLTDTLVAVATASASDSTDIDSYVVPETGSYTITFDLRSVIVLEGVLAWTIVDQTATTKAAGFINSVSPYFDAQFTVTTTISATAGDTLTFRIDSTEFQTGDGITYTISPAYIYIVPATAFISQDITLVAETQYLLSLERTGVDNASIQVYETANPANVIFVDVLAPGSNYSQYFTTITGVTAYTLKITLAGEMCVDNVSIILAATPDLKLYTSSGVEIFDTAVPAVSTEVYITKESIGAITQFDFDFTGGGTALDEGCYYVELYDANNEGFDPVQSNLICICDDYRSCDAPLLINYTNTTNVAYGNDYYDYENFSFVQSFRIKGGLSFPSFTNTFSNYEDCAGFVHLNRGLQRKIRQLTCAHAPFHLFECFAIALMHSHFSIDGDRYQLTGDDDVNLLDDADYISASFRVNLNKVGDHLLNEPRG